MKTIIRTAILAALLLCSALIYSQAATDDQPQPPCEALAANSATMPGMMVQGMDEMPCGRPGMMAGAPCPRPCNEEGPIRARHHMRDREHGMAQMDCEMMARGHGMHQMDGGMMGMGHGKMGRHGGGMHHQMGRMLFLDRAEALELTPDQVSKLKAIHADCRRENIRQGAEVRIARLELKDLVAESNWIPAAAEKLVRKIKTLEGDMQVRHLRAVAEARKVLTADQLRKAEAGRDDDAEDLFR